LKYLEKDSYFRLCVSIDINHLSVHNDSSHKISHLNSSVIYWLKTKGMEPDATYVVEG